MVLASHAHAHQQIEQYHHDDGSQNLEEVAQRLLPKQQEEYQCLWDARLHGFL